MQQIAIEVKNITKKFGNFIANSNISIKFQEKSIHALIGENGAGKSTLINQIFGLLKPTSGIIKINNKKVNISSPNDASDLGLSMVHQHFQLVDNHTVLENIILGQEKTKLFLPINYKKAYFQLLKISKKYNLKVNLNKLVKNVSIGEQQRIEILKMLYQGAKILIFDEPTSMLTPQEIQGLLDLFIDLKNQGKTIIFISHKLNEIKQVADTGTIIRLGKVIGTFNVKNTSTDKMAEMMVGRKLVATKNNIASPQSSNAILKINNIYVKHHSNSKVYGLKNFSLNLKAGEILTIAGIEGNGQHEIVNAITGLQKYYKGSIEVQDQNKKFVKLKNNDVDSRYKLGLSFVPEDRYKFAMLKKENLLTNVILQTFKNKPFSILGFLTRKPKIEWAQKIIQEFDVRGSYRGKSPIGDLSGGNQQKFIVGREMTKQHKIIILFQPTRGLDIGAIEFIHKKIIDEKRKGNAILLVSYELSEVMSLADRIAVVNQGKLVKVTSSKGITREQIGKWMMGVI